MKNPIGIACVGIGNAPEDREKGDVDGDLPAFLVLAGCGRIRLGRGILVLALPFGTPVPTPFPGLTFDFNLGVVMRDNLAVGGTMLAVVVMTAIIVIVSTNQPKPLPPPLEATCRTVHADPSLYSDREFTLRTNGCQPTKDPQQWVYRTIADGEPIVVLTFLESIKELPAEVSAQIIGRLPGGTVILSCRIPNSKVH